jgi:hypothetical protein
MSYERGVPRYFFNEAKLLNCLGKLALAIHEYTKPLGLEFVIEWDGEAFDVCQGIDGDLYVSNYEVQLESEYVYLSIPYNCKTRKYPLMAEWKGELYKVLNEEGELIWQQE